MLLSSSFLLLQFLLQKQDVCTAGFKPKWSYSELADTVTTAFMCVKVASYRQISEAGPKFKEGLAILNKIFAHTICVTNTPVGLSDFSVPSKFLLSFKM